MPHELPNDFRLKELRKLGNIRNVLKLHTGPSAQSSCQNANFGNTSKLNFSCSALFRMKIRASLKYFVHDCLWKQIFVSDSPQTL